MYQAFAVAREFRPPSRKHVDDLLKDLDFLAVQFDLTVTVMHEENAGRESHLKRKRNNLLGLFRRTSADDTANHYWKTGIIPEPLEASLEVIQNLLRRLVGVNPINGDLHFLQPSLVERFNHLRTQKETVGDHAGAVEAKLAASANEAGKIRVQCGFATGQRDAKCTKLLEFPKTVLQHLHGHWVAGLIILGAIST